MTKSLSLFCAALGLGASLMVSTPVSADVSGAVDLKKYQGEWHEIATIPQFFQRKCVANVKATYTLRDDGKVRVLNTCKKEDGSIQVADGQARSVSEDNRKLKVSFVWPYTWPFEGDYWILALQDEYKLVLVSNEDRSTFWMLAREPKLPEETIQAWLQKAKNLGIDLSKVKRSIQD